MSVSEQFKTDVRDWIAYDNKIDKAENAIKRVKDKKYEIQKNIVHYMNTENLQGNEIKMSNVRLHYKEKKHITPITKNFLENTLSQELQPGEVYNILKLLYDPKKRLEVCLSHVLGDEYKASELVKTIYEKRLVTYNSVINKKVTRIPVTIDTGPISEMAQQTLHSPENSDSV